MDPRPTLEGMNCLEPVFPVAELCVQVDDVDILKDHLQPSVTDDMCIHVRV